MESELYVGGESDITLAASSGASDDDLDYSESSNNPPEILDN